MKPSHTPSRLLFGLLMGVFVTQTAFSQATPVPSKPATAATKAANQKVLEQSRTGQRQPEPVAQCPAERQERLVQSR